MSDRSEWVSRGMAVDKREEGGKLKGGTEESPPERRGGTEGRTQGEPTNEHPGDAEQSRGRAEKERRERERREDRGEKMVERGKERRRG
jgi:hypothetical protein